MFLFGDGSVCKEGKRRAAASRTVHRCAGDHVDVWGEGLACEPRGSHPRSRIKALRALRVLGACRAPLASQHAVL